MKLPLDTATVLWIASDSARLSSTARTAYADPGNELYLSVASLWAKARCTGFNRFQMSTAIRLTA
jgi:PIN domain nuclease of toxin-antitoxin system